MTMLLAVGCSGQDERVQAQEITKETVCALDGMLLWDYPGPKGQIHYEQGPPDFFCDTMEIFALYLRPEQQKQCRCAVRSRHGKSRLESTPGSLDRCEDRLLCFWQQTTRLHGADHGLVRA
jgi:copper chaperone NosL